MNTNNSDSMDIDDITDEPSLNITQEDIDEHLAGMELAGSVICPRECISYTQYETDGFYFLNVRQVGKIYHMWQDMAAVFMIADRLEDMFFCINQVVLMRAYVEDTWGSDVTHIYYLNRLKLFREYLRNVIDSDYMSASGYEQMPIHDLTTNKDILAMCAAV